MNSAARRFNAELSAVRAAAEAGLEVAEFQRRLRSSGQLVAKGFGQLLVGNGGVKRDAWEQSFGEVTLELWVGEPAPGPFTLVRSQVVPRV